MSLRGFATLLILSLVFVFSGCSDGTSKVKYSYTGPTGDTAGGEEKGYFGVVVFNSGWIGIYDSVTRTVNTPLLVGELGSSGGGLFDVVITPDGDTTLVSNFGDATVYFIDTSDPTDPYVLGSLFLEMFAEDIALTPDGAYALVSDGGFSTGLAIIDVESRTLVEMYDDGVTQHQAVTVSPDGQTVLTVNYFGGLVNVFTIDEDGELTFVESIDVSNGGTLDPLNVAISPDGQTAVVATTGGAFPILNITGPGQVELTDIVTPILGISASQSVVFSPAGDRAAVYCVPAGYDDDTPDVIIVLDITGPGQAVDADLASEVDFYGRSQLFGVDTLATDKRGAYVFVSNMTMGDASTYIQILDTSTGDVVETIDFDPVDEDDAYPVGLAIGRR